MLRFQPPSSCSCRASQALPIPTPMRPSAMHQAQCRRRAPATRSSAGGGDPGDGAPGDPRRDPGRPGRSSPVTGRSPHRSRGSWRHGPGSGGGCSPTRPPGSCAHAVSTGSRRRCAGSCRPGTGCARTPAVTGPPRTADLDHANATTRTGRPARATSRPAAAGTTMRKPTTDGGSNPPPTAAT